MYRVKERKGICTKHKTGMDWTVISPFGVFRLSSRVIVLPFRLSSIEQ